MSKCTANDYVPKTIPQELIIVDELFEGLRVKLNQYKMEGKLPHQEVVILPAALGLMSECIRAFVESQPDENKEKVKKVVASLIRRHVEESIPWDEITEYALEETGLN